MDRRALRAASEEDLARIDEALAAMAADVAAGGRGVAVLRGPHRTTGT